MLGQIDIFGNVEGRKMIIYRGYKLEQRRGYILICDQEGMAVKKVPRGTMRQAKAEVDRLINWGNAYGQR